MTDVLEVSEPGSRVQSEASRREVRYVTSATASGWSGPTSIPRVILDPQWYPNAVRRLQELADLGENWDSYGGHALEVEALRRCVQFLLEHRSAMQVGPSISLTPEGGLFIEWRSNESELLVQFENDRDEITFELGVDGRTFAGGVDQFVPYLDKWLWSASSVSV